MTQIKLKRLLSKKKEASPIVNALIGAMSAPISIQDTEGNTLIGPPNNGSQGKYPITCGNDLIGWTRGQQRAELVAALLTFLANKEAERVTLADEMLERYRELNLLYIPLNLLVNEEPPYATATGIIEAFRRTWSQSLAEAPQFENVVLHSLLLLIEHRLSLVELPRLLLDEAFREALLRASQQPKIMTFFKQRFGRWGREQAQRVESTPNKFTALTLNPNLEPILGAEENWLDLRRIVDGGKVLIVNLGTCDSETRNLLGSLLTVRLEQAALSRADLREEDRIPWYWVIDEMQRFVASEGSAQVLAEILSEVRKFGLRLLLAHQGWHQIEKSSRLAGALDQAQVKVVFGSGTKTGRVIAEELFSPDPEKVKHQVDDPQAQARSHPVYENLLEQKEMFVQVIRNQPPRSILVLPPDSNQVVSLQTITVPQPEVAAAELEAIKVRLLRKVGQPVTELRAQINRGMDRYDELKTLPVFWPTLLLIRAGTCGQTGRP